MNAFNSIMQKRPTYKSLPISHVEVTTSQDDLQAQLTDRSHKETKINNYNSLPPTPKHISTPQHKKPLTSMFKTRKKRDSFDKVDEVFNQISDLNKKDQILQAIKKLSAIDQRVLLLDRILKRREEQSQANLLFQMEKLAPIFKIITKKLKKTEDPPAPKMVRPNTHRVNTLRIEREEQQVDLEKLKEHESELEGKQKELMEKLAQKFTSSLAHRLFAKKTPEQIESEAVSPCTQRRLNRQSTQLRMVFKQDLKIQNQLVVKIKENSNQFLLDGKSFGVDYLKRRSVRDIMLHAKPKVDSGVNFKLPDVVGSQNHIEFRKAPRKGIKYKHVLFQ